MKLTSIFLNPKYLLVINTVVNIHDILTHANHIANQQMHSKDAQSNGQITLTKLWLIKTHSGSKDIGISTVYIIQHDFMIKSMRFPCLEVKDY